MLHKLLTAHGISLLVLCLILTASISVRYADRRLRRERFRIKARMGDLMRAAVCIIVGFALVVAYGFAVRYGHLPDSVSTALFTAFPGLLILLLGFWFLVRSGYKAVCGVAKR